MSNPNYMKSIKLRIKSDCLTLDQALLNVLSFKPFRLGKMLVAIRNWSK